MPTTRRSTGNRPATRSKDSAKKATQTKLAFHSTSGQNRISKHGASDSHLADKKKAVELEAALPSHESPLAVDVSFDNDAETVHDVELEEEPLSDSEAAAEREARNVSQAQMKKYWTTKEKEMKAPRAHLQHASIAERILREWDVDGRFGPCIGITRTQRWRRAHNLGLHPPIEVLAALIQEVQGEGSGKESEKMDVAMIDRLMTKSTGGV